MLLSVFTPTYNRGKFLHRIYESLAAQERIFEWIIVDDGSEDDTEKIAEEIRKDADFPIKYVKKPNGGKHTAHNLAARLADGEFFMCLDSDDTVEDGAFGEFKKYVSRLSDGDCGFIAYKKLRSGGLICAELPCGDTHRNMYEYSSVYTAGGEFTLIFRTELIRKYPFPEYPGEKFISECVLYDRLDLDGYTVCPFPFPVEVCEYQPDGLSANFYRLLMSSGRGYGLYHIQRIDLVRSLRERFSHAVKYHSFRILCGGGEKYDGCHRILVFLTAPLGVFGAIYYKIKSRRGNG